MRLNNLLKLGIRNIENFHGVFRGNGMIVPNTFSFLITTVYGEEFFLNLYKVTKNKKYLGIAQSVGNWIINECGYKKEDEGIWFYYSDCEVFHYPIFNAISKASGYLAKLYMYTKKRHFQTMAELAAVYIINKQNRDGS